MSSGDVTPSKPACTKMDLYKILGLSVLHLRNNKVFENDVPVALVTMELGGVSK